MEISRCFPWLSHHRQGEKRDSFETLPDDVIVDVLSRLEVDQLGCVKRVCRRWRALIGTAHFTRVHLQRTSSVTVMGSMFSERRFHRDMPFLFYYDWGSREKKLTRGAKLLVLRRLRRTSQSSFDLLGCCDGLLIFIEPITKSIETPDGFSYHVGSLGPAAREEVGMFPYRPREQEAAPSGVKGCLHWMVVGKEQMSPPCSHSIMVFSTGESEFRFMPHPGDSCPSTDGHSNMHLVAMRGRVYVYAIYGKLMCVWVLEDYASWHWVKKCDVNLERGLRRHPVCVILSYSEYKNMQLIDSRDGELLLFWPGRGFLRYNLRLEKTTKVRWKLSMYGMMGRVVVAELKRSLVSLKHLQ
ncbi:hypothetical protein NL676_019795 [Syzygium grande]|nr:hypothetical protein NL676_019795 [Syzygium grande]